MGNVIKVTGSNIGEIIKTNKITIVCFHAIWCGPCRILTPTIEELARDNSDVVVGKVNVDDSGAIASEYGIRGIPALIFFKEGEIIDRVVGVKSKSELQGKIDSLK